LSGNCTSPSGIPAARGVTVAGTALAGSAALLVAGLVARPDCRDPSAVPPAASTGPVPDRLWPVLAADPTAPTPLVAAPVAPLAGP
jgi:hypothetical protein